MIRVSMVFLARSSSLALGPVSAKRRSSSLMAVSSSSAVWPGLAVASIVNLDPRISDSWVVVTVCAICLS